MFAATNEQAVVYQAGGSEGLLVLLHLQCVRWVFQFISVVLLFHLYLYVALLLNQYKYHSQEDWVLADAFVDQFNLVQFIHLTLLFHVYYLIHARPNATNCPGHPWAT